MLQDRNSTLHMMQEIYTSPNNHTITSSWSLHFFPHPQ